jgi:hypothetical protein
MKAPTVQLAAGIACSLFTLSFPAEARFLQVDPIGYEDQTNLYTYVGDDPVNRSDPTGRTILARRGQEEEIARRINTHTNGIYRASGSNGALRRVGFARTTNSRIPTLGYYDRRLGAAIASDKTITLAVGNTVRLEGRTLSIYDLGGGGTFPDTETGNQTVVVGNRGVNVARDTSGNALLQTPADLLMHELVVHAIPNITGVDTHNGEENENRVRRERNLPERGPDDLHPPQ